MGVWVRVGRAWLGVGWRGVGGVGGCGFPQRGAMQFLFFVRVLSCVWGLRLNRTGEETRYTEKGWINDKWDMKDRLMYVSATWLDAILRFPAVLRWVWWSEGNNRLQGVGNTG